MSAFAPILLALAGLANAYVAFRAGTMVWFSIHVSVMAVCWSAAIVSLTRFAEGRV